MTPSISNFAMQVIRGDNQIEETMIRAPKMSLHPMLSLSSILPPPQKSRPIQDVSLFPQSRLIEIT